MKRALITGVTGQDGSYLAELLLEKGYEVLTYQLPEMTKDNDDRVLGLARLLKRIDVLKEAGRQEVLSTPIEDRKKKVRGILSDPANE